MNTLDFLENAVMRHMANGTESLTASDLLSIILAAKAKEEEYDDLLDRQHRSFMDDNDPLGQDF